MTTVAERLSMIRDFHKKFGEPIAPEPLVPGMELARFRAQLILEEALELVRALGFEVEAHRRLDTVTMFLEKGRSQPDLVKIVDSLRDLEYVMGGTEVALGLQEASEPTFVAVHRANMKKQPSDLLGGNKKPTKPPGWHPPDVCGVLQKLFPTKRLLFRE